MIGRNELIESLVLYFDSIYGDKSQNESYRKFMNAYGVNDGRFNAYVLQMLDLHSVSDEELYWLASFPKTHLKTENYFSKDEQKSYAKSLYETGAVTFPIEFQNVLPIAEDQFVTTIDTKTLRKLYNSNLLIYNVETQRAPKVYEADGKQYYKINVNKNSVAEIKSLLERGLFIPNDLTLNLRYGETDFEYDLYQGTLVIHYGPVDILDGFHRIMAIMRVMNEHPEFEKHFVLNLMNFHEDKAKRFVAQQDKRNKIHASYLKSLDDTRFETIVVNRLNENPNSVLFGQIKTAGRRQIDFGKTVGLVRNIFHPDSIQDAEVLERNLEQGLKAHQKETGIPLTDEELKILFSYLYLVRNRFQVKTYEKIETYFLHHPEDTKTLSAVKRQIKSFL